MSNTDFIRRIGSKFRYRDKLQSVRSREELKQILLSIRENDDFDIFVDVLKIQFPIYYEILEPLILLK